MDVSVLGVVRKVTETEVWAFILLGTCLSSLQFMMVPSSQGILQCFVQHKEGPAISFGQCELVWTLKRSKESIFPTFILLCMDFSALNAFPCIVFHRLTP